MRKCLGYAIGKHQQGVTKAQTGLMFAVLHVGKYPEGHIHTRRKCLNFAICASDKWCVMTCAGIHEGSVPWVV